MADYSEEDVARAEEVFGRLLTPQRAEDDLPLFDVENDIRNFLQELTLQNAGFGRVPVMRLGDGNSAPVSLAFASIKRTREGPDFSELEMREIEEQLDYRGMALAMREAAQAQFFQGAIRFVATRIAGIRAFSRREAVTKSILNVRHSV